MCATPCCCLLILLLLLTNHLGELLLLPPLPGFESAMPVCDAQKHHVRARCGYTTTARTTTPTIPSHARIPDVCLSLHTTVAVLQLKPSKRCS